MTPRERAMAALRGGRPDKTPFLSDIVPPVGAMERELRNRGMGICKWTASYACHTPHVERKAIHYRNEKGRDVVRTVCSTPHGDISTLVEPAGFTTWKLEYPFKSPDDYRRLLFMVEDTVVEPRYEEARKLIREGGDDVLTVDFAWYSPMQEIVLNYMGTERFCYEWADNRDEILRLYKAVADWKRKVLRVAAGGPHDVVLYDANIVPQLIGRENFAKHFLPNYEEAAETVHRAGKLIGGHFDADNAPFMELIARTGLDFINAYDAGISPPVKEARKAWPGKALWLNYPSAWHLLTEPEIKEKTIGLIEEAAPGNGFIIGITETVPPDRLLGNYRAIMDGIDEYERRAKGERGG